MPYGTVKVDNVTFTNNSVDATTTFSGIYASITDNLTLSGTATATTFTGTTANFTNVNAQNIGVTTSLSGLAITGGTAGFTTITGTTVTGTTANFVTVSGTTVTGTTARFITITGGTAGFTTITGTTVTGTTANFVTVSGTTVTGTTASFTSGIFTSLSGTTHTITSGVFASGTAALPSISFVSDPNTGIYSPGADQVAVATSGVARLFVDAAGSVGVGAAPTSKLSVIGGAIRAETTASGNTGYEIYNGTRNTGISSDFANSLTYIDHNEKLVFRDSQNAYAERLRITSTGRVGIGTSSPTGLLTVAASAPVIDWANLSNTAFKHTIEAVNYSSTAASNTFAFKVASGSGTQATVMTLNGAGNVGIGTTSPGSALSIDGSSALGALGSGAPVITLKNTDTTNFNATQIVNRDSGGNIAGGISFRNDSHGASGSTGLLLLTRNSGTNRESLVIGAAGTTTLNSAASTAPFIAQINSAEAARIDSSGRLLVGTSTASTALGSLTAKLQVQGTNVFDTGITNTLWEASANPVQYQLVKSRGASIGTHTVVQDNDTLGRILFGGSDGTDFETGAWIQCQVDGTPGTNDMPGRLVFSTTADGASSPTERLRITSAGVLQIADAGNITVGTTTGTKIGTATTQKLGFYNATPVVQPTAVADATTAVDVITQLNALLAKLRTLGIIAT